MENHSAEGRGVDGMAGVRACGCSEHHQKMISALLARVVRCMRKTVTRGNRKNATLRRDEQPHRFRDRGLLAR